MNHDLDKMSLPKSSRNQELEVISKRVFEPLFDVERFILKSEPIDNGIDYRCEIKYNGKVTGFCFNFQLKSKESAEPKKDGSYSKSLELSNIEYLFSNGHPAFYGFYIVEVDSFYYEYLDDFIANLNDDTPDWQSQQNHTLSFSKKIDKHAVDTIYEIAMKKGKMLREINGNLVSRLSQTNFGQKILIDFDGNVESDDELKEIIEKFGFELINQTNWNKVIDLHNKTSNSLLRAARYNMIVGLAYYYTGDYLSSLKFLKESQKEKNDLDLELQNHLTFITASVKLLFHMINEEEFKNIIAKLPPDKHITFHIQIDHAIEILKERLYRTEEIRIEEFESALQSIVSNPDASPHVKLRAKSELLIYEGKIALQDYKKYVCQINAFEESYGVNLPLRQEVSEKLELLFKEIEKQSSTLYKEAEEANNYFAFFYLFTYKQKYDFEKFSTFEILKVVKEPTLNQDFSEEYEQITNNIEQCINYFESIAHVENQLFSMATKYEILHYRKQAEEANILLDIIDRKVELMDIKILCHQVDFLKNGGTNHQMLQDLLDDKINNPKEKIEELRLELIQFDENEKNINVNKADYFQVTLFPIGDFCIPRSSLEQFFVTFEIKKNKLRQQFKDMFEFGVVPVVNTYVYPIKAEGPQEGNLEYKGFESFLNMYNARKKFFENEFYRIRNK